VSGEVFTPHRRDLDSNPVSGVDQGPPRTGDVAFAGYALDQLINHRTDDGAVLLKARDGLLRVGRENYGSILKSKAGGRDGERRGYQSDYYLGETPPLMFQIYRLSNIMVSEPEPIQKAIGDRAGHPEIVVLLISADSSP